MARPRVYQSKAAKQAAYRERLRSETVPVERQAVEALLRAVEAADVAGDPVARAVRTGTIDSLLRNLALHFERIAAAPSARKPSATR